MNAESLRYAPSIIVAGLVLLVAYFLARALLGVLDILVVVFLGTVLAVILEPVATLLTRFKVPRVASILLIYALAFGLFSLFAWYAIPNFADEFDGLVDRIEELGQDYDDFAENSGLPSVDDLREYLEQVAEAVGPTVTSQALAGASVLLSLFLILVVAVFCTAVQGSARNLFLSLISTRYRELWDRVLDVIARRLQRFAIGQIASMVIVGTLTYVGLVIIGMPFAFTLAMIAFITELLPLVGPWIGFLPALAIAATEGWKEIILVSVLYLAIQQLESNVVVPLVQRRQAELPALIIFVSILVGGALLGVLGALAAMPAAIIIHTVLTKVVIPWRQQEADADLPPAEEETAEAAERDAAE